MQRKPHQTAGEPRLTVTRSEPNQCVVCKSPDVWFHVAYRDRMNPPDSINFKKGGHLVPHNDYLHACKKHVSAACAILLVRNDLVEEEEEEVKE